MQIGVGYMEIWQKLATKGFQDRLWILRFKNSYPSEAGCSNRIHKLRF